MITTSPHCVVVIMEPLPLRAPLWSIALITDLADGGAEAQCPRKHLSQSSPILLASGALARSGDRLSIELHTNRLDACAKAQ